MKREKIISYALTTLLACMFTTIGFSQPYENTIKEERAGETFNAISAGETFIINYTPGDNYSVVVETIEGKIDQISTEVISGVLLLKNNNLRSPAVLNVSITSPFLTEIDLSGASEFYTNGDFKTESLKIKTGGAAKAEIKCITDDLQVKMYGASELSLSGESAFMDAIIEGTSILNATEMEVVNANVNSKSKTVAQVNVSENLNITTYGTAQVHYPNNPKNVTKNRIAGRYEQGGSRTFIIDDDKEYDDNTRFGRLNITVGDCGDSTIVMLGRHQFVIDEWGNTRYRKIYRKRFNGNWGGIDLAITGYLTPNFNLDYGDDYYFLDLNLGSSTRFDINLLEQSMPVSKNNHWGFITGVGFEFRNYHFDNNITLISDEPEIIGYTNDGASPKKNKLTATYVNIPLLFEYQTNAYSEPNSFHISLGMVMGLRIGAKTKMVFEDKNITYDLVDINGVYVDTRTTPDKRRIKEHNSFHLNPIKADAMFRIGWGWFNFFATYSVTTLFKTDEGPELYPFSFGLTLLKW